MNKQYIQFKPQGRTNRIILQQQFDEALKLLQDNHCNCDFTITIPMSFYLWDKDYWLNYLQHHSNLTLFIVDGDSVFWLNREGELQF